MTTATRRGRRGPQWSWAAGVLASWLVAGVAGAGERTLLVTEATWVDASEQSGRMLFQGEIVDGVLTGRAYPGNGTELVVSGTVDGDGDIAGTLNDTAQELVATFTGELDANQELVGDLYFAGSVDAAWAAPADELPTE